MVAMMDTLAIYEHFREVLGEDKAKAFAYTLGRMIEEAKNAATKDDIRLLDGHVNRLEAAIARLAEAQAGAEERLGRVEERLDRVEGRLNRVEDRLDRLEAVVERLAEAQARAEDRLGRVEERLDRLEAAVERLVEAQTRTEERLDRLERVVEDLAASVKNLARQVGGLSEAVGANLEEFACELVPELLEKYWGMSVASAMPEEFDVGGAPKEFDLVVRGTVKGRPVVVLGETKARVTPPEVARFLRIVEEVRAGRPGDDVRAVFFGYRANRETQELITSAGASMVFTRGVIIPTA